MLGKSRLLNQIRDRLGLLPIQAGDVLLLVGPSERLTEAAQWLGAYSLAERGLGVTQHGRAAFATGIFAVAVALAAFEIVYLPIALAAVVAVLAAALNAENRVTAVAVSTVAFNLTMIAALGENADT